MTDRIYAISLWQPWASLIFARVDGSPVKVHETRHWVPSEPGVVKRGSRILIHAAKTTRGYSQMSSQLHEICQEVFPYACAYRGFLPLGAALGTVELRDWYPANQRWTGEDDYACGDFSVGRFAWRLAEPDAFAAPVPMKGRQGFWRVAPGEVVL
jgi:activating signal cointegrator 1